MTKETFWLSRSLFIRGLGAMYLIASLIIIFQMKALIGEDGLSPIPKDLPNPWNYPSLLLFFPNTQMIQILGWAMGATALILTAGYCNWLLLLVLYVGQLSFVNGGGLFYGFGWETMMVELTFMTIFVTHPWRLKISQENYLFPGRWNQLLFFWLLFKLMLGAGLIKLRGDACWWSLTCMDYHYETQPNPNPLSWYYHQLPTWFHRFEVMFNHFIEVLVPFALLTFRTPRHIAGFLIIFFQVVLISTGNLAYINWQTLVIALMVFDDRFLLSLKNYFFPKISVRLPKREQLQWEKYFAMAAIALVAFLNIPVVTNLIRPDQSMNQSYSRWHLVNSYGLFGGITKERFEIIISGTTDSLLTDKTVWQEYEFYCKPGRVDRRPCWISPYHLRLDWQMWFSAMRPQLQERWLASLAEMMLRNDTSLKELLIENPFDGQAPPKYLKMDLYRYKFTGFDEGNSNWWRREFVQPYMAPARFN